MWKFKKSTRSELEETEQRRYHRIKIIVGLVCRRSQGNNINVFTDDVSEGGIRFFSQQSLEKKEDVSLEIPSGYGEMIRIEGRVIWIDQKGPHNYAGGIEFTRLSEENLQVWKKFIRRNSMKGQELD
ncbi:MAG: PilZ domain-containing protein [Candidatus Eremiobacteraeota bacterium]|nr:PilZ domain-containing protein [Candidatus Eremiobacteraeota bacterium]